MIDGMPAVRVKAEPLESEQGVREQLFSRQFSFFPAFLSFFPPLGNGADNHSQAWVSERLWGLRGVFGEHGSRQKDEKNHEEEKSHSWGRNAVGSFGEVTGASRVHAGWG